MPDQKTDQEEAENAALAAEFGDSFVKPESTISAEDPAPDPAPEPAVEEEATLEEEVPEETPEEEPKEVVEDDKDPYSSLEDDEEPTEEEPEAEADDVPQYQLDAKRLAAKWSKLSPEEQLEKATNLRDRRSNTFEALAKELGYESGDLLEEDLLEAETPEKDYSLETTDLQKLKEELKREAKEELMQELNPVLKKNLDDRIVSTLQSFATENKITGKGLESLTDPRGEVRKNFERLTKDPETGLEMPFNRRMRMALQLSPSVQNTLNDQRAQVKAMKLATAQKQKLVSAGGGSATVIDLGSLSEAEILAMDDKAFLEAADRMAGGKKW